MLSGMCGMWGMWGMCVEIGNATRIMTNILWMALIELKSHYQAISKPSNLDKWPISTDMG